MRSIHLIRHGPVTVRPGRPPSDWPLTEGAPAAIFKLAERHLPHGTTHLYASPEPKAAQTAQHLAIAVGAQVLVYHGLEEHHRTASGFIDDQDRFRATLARFFDTPDTLVWGKETANQARQRFARALDAIVTAHPDASPIVVVTHGTVMSLVLATPATPPIDIWSSIKTPDHRLLDWPTL